MSHGLSVRARAKIDAAEIVTYLSDQSVPAAENFIAALEESFIFLQDWPESGGLTESEPLRSMGIRITLVSGFRNYLIIYRVREMTVEILRITHASRDQANLLDNLE